MTIFTQYEEKTLTLKRKLLITAMIFIIVPAWAWLCGKHEYRHSDQRRMAMPVSLALPAQLPTNSKVWEF